MDIFSEVDKFFRSLSGYLDWNYVFIIFVALFLLTVVIVLVSTSHAYEAKLIKAVDKFNTYFMENPQITQENLITFNDKMKNKNVPKQLRKQWQQFVLYRDKRASEYMSFELCVSAPLRNSTFKRDITTMNIVAYILSALSLILNVYRSYEENINDVFKHILLCPIIILTINFIITIFLNIHHSSIVNDLHQNYQFFEVNIDKATQTLPEYVDYEVLFDRMEIKRGIPILYAYLQKRAEEEQKELDRARLRNVEHEKFNFDESGVESSLVLDRAMEEAENYIAERKKFYEDMAQINEDISQEELNFREITKEYQRQNQVSKEAFENFKSQLAEATSSIEINYLKKQQQQELDRQRNLERDFDTASERHKKVLEGYQEELTAVENEIKKVKANLEKGMMSEFKSYSMKVYDEASKVVEDVNAAEFNRLKNKIKQLEEKILAKEEEINNIYNQNQTLSEKLAEVKPDEDLSQYIVEAPQVETHNLAEEIAEAREEMLEDLGEEDSTIPDESVETEVEAVEVKPAGKRGRPRKVKPEGEVEAPKPAGKRGRPRKERPEGEEEKPKPAGKRGRPRKERPEGEVEAPKTAGKRGRPRKERSEGEEEKPKVPGKRGRPRKEKPEGETPKVPGKRGRPRKGDTPTEAPAEVVPEVAPQDAPEAMDDIDQYLKEIDAQIAEENAKIEESTKALESKSKIGKKK